MMTDVDDDDGISELCDLLSGQPLWCGEENALILQCSFDVTRRMLEKPNAVNPSDLRRHLEEVRRRYRAMLTVEDWLESERLKTYVHVVLSPAMDQSMCLFLAFYIDHELIRLNNLGRCDVIDDD